MRLRARGDAALWRRGERDVCALVGLLQSSVRAATTGLRVEQHDHRRHALSSALDALYQPTRLSVQPRFTPSRVGTCRVEVTTVYIGARSYAHQARVIADGTEVVNRSPVGRLRRNHTETGWSPAPPLETAVGLLTATVLPAEL